MTVKRSKGAIMEKKNFNFDVMQSKASDVIKLTGAQNEYAFNCYDVIFGSHSKNEKSEKEIDSLSFGACEEEDCEDDEDDEDDEEIES